MTRLQTGQLENMTPIARRMLGEGLDEPRQVLVKQRPVDYHVCPHCNQEIHEKGVYENDDGILRHRSCGGAIQMPPVDWSQVRPEWRAILQGKA